MSARNAAYSADSWALVFSSQSETESFGHALGQAVEGGEVLALIGELGAGKTALVRGIAAGLKAPLDSVSSPTFTLIHEYRGRLPLIHIDLYRLQTQMEAQNIGLEEYFRDGSVVAVEWADRFPDLLPPDRLEVRLAHKTPKSRGMQAQAHGRHARELLVRMKAAWPLPRRHQTMTTVERETPSR